MLIIKTRNKSRMLQVAGHLLSDSTVVSLRHPSKEGDVVLVCGGKNLKELQSMGIVPKNRTVASLRGNPIQYQGRTIFITYDPYLVDKDYEVRVAIECDVRLAARVAEAGLMSPGIGTYLWSTDLDIARCEIEGLLENGPVPVSVDLETVGLNEYDPTAFIVSIFLTWKQGYSLGVRFQGVEDQPFIFQNEEYQVNPDRALLAENLKWFFSHGDIEIIGANLRYDRRWMRRKWGLEVENFKFDTTLVGSLLDENVSNSLSVHAMRFTDMGGYDHYLNTVYDKSRMDLVPDEDLLTYAGGDTDAAYRVAQIFAKALYEDERLGHFYDTVLHSADDAFLDIEDTGVYVDVEYFQSLQLELENHLQELTDSVYDLMPNYIKYKYWGESSSGVPNFRLSRSCILKDFLFGERGLKLKPKIFTKKSGEPSTAFEHLKMFQDVPAAAQFIDALHEYNTAKKTLSTYVVGFLKHLREDGRFHPNFALYKGKFEGGEDGGTNTGRSSAKNPALQCLEGSMRVLTDKGWIPIVTLVRDYEVGGTYNVVTHTGEVRPVIGVYRNGVRPVLTISFDCKRAVTATENHPFLTNRGWVLAENLNVGDICYGLKEELFRASNKELYEFDISQLGGDEESVSKQNQQRLQELRGAGYSVVQALASVPELFERHGGKARCWLVDRAGEQQRRLLSGELCLGDSENADAESKEQQIDYLFRENSDRGGLGEGVRDKPGEVALSTKGVENAYVGSFEKGTNIDCWLFEKFEVESIVADGRCETYDLTIAGSHSFVAEGIVVHNTLPKHSKYAPKLRKGYPAPEDYVIVEFDISQGELRFVSVVANEPTMKQMYRDGVDLHLVTGGKIHGLSVSDMLELKQQDLKLFKKYRQSGKPANFGIIYKISPEGYQKYAANYGVPVTLEQATETIKKFFDLFPMIAVWHEQQIQFARTNGFVRNPFGRVRHLPLINSSDKAVRAKTERQSINTVIQSALSDWVIYCIGRFKKKYGRPAECKPFMFTHDSVHCYILRDQLNIWVPRVKGLLEDTQDMKNTLGFEFDIPMVADAVVGYNLGDMVDYKDFKQYEKTKLY